MSERLLTSHEVSERLRITPRCLQLWIAAGKAPPHCRLGRLIRFPETNFNAWLADKVQPANELGK